MDKIARDAKRGTNNWKVGFKSFGFLVLYYKA